MQNDIRDAATGSEELTVETEHDGPAPGSIT